MVSIAIGNAKGGVGKTTAAVNVGAALALAGRSVCLLDLDPQGSLSTWFNLTGGDELVAGLRSRDLAGLPVAVRPGLDVIPGGKELALQGARILEDVETLRGVLALSGLRYDFLLIDCAPSMGPLVYNALAASTGVLVVCECSLLALAGLAQYEELLEAAGVKVVAVQPSRLVHTKHSQKALSTLKGRYKARLLPAVPETVLLRNAAVKGKTIFEVARTHAAALAFEAAAAKLQGVK